MMMPSQKRGKKDPDKTEEMRMQIKSNYDPIYPIMDIEIYTLVNRVNRPVRCGGNERMNVRYSNCNTPVLCVQMIL